MSPIYETAEKIAKLVRTRQLSSEEVVAAHLERIAAHNGQINALAHVDGERACADARRLDAAIARGQAPGPLAGVPISIKDLYEVEGMPSTSGTCGRIGHLPKRDATVVSRLRRAGAIVLGKSNTPEFGLALETTNLVSGTTCNPYDVARTSGGSSGGAAAALAAGFSALELGSDGGGSIRIPAHFCGVAGLKPTSRRISSAGHFPVVSGVAAHIVGYGPLARSVSDLLLAFPVLLGEDDEDPSALPALEEVESGKRIKELRVAFYTDNGIRTPDAATVALVERCAAALERAGARVTEARLPSLADALDIHLGLLITDRSTIYDWKKAAGTDTLHPWIQAGLDFLEDAAQDFDSNTPSLLCDDWRQFRLEATRFMQPYDVLLTPVAPGPALPHGEISAAGNLDWISYTCVHNLTGWPAAVVRCGTSPEGLPLGVQVVGRPFRDVLALRVAEFLEYEFGGFQAPMLAGERP